MNGHLKNRLHMPNMFLTVETIDKIAFGFPEQCLLDALCSSFFPSFLLPVPTEILISDLLSQFSGFGSRTT